MAYLTSDLIEDIRFQCRLSDLDPDYTTARLLKLASQELNASVYPFLISLREDFFIQESQTQVTSGQNFYEVSPRSFASALRDVKLVHSTTGQTINLKRYDLEDPQGNQSKPTGIPTGFFLEDNYIILDTIPSDSNWNLLQYIWLKPSKLVLPTECATLVSQNSPGTWTISSPSGTVTTNLQNSTKGLDIINAESPHNTKCFQNVIWSNSTTITGVYGNPKNGDYVCVYGQNPTIGIPEEFCQLLILSVSARVFEGLNLQTELQTVVGKLQQLKDTLKMSIAPRVEGAQKQIVSIL